MRLVKDLIAARQEIFRGHPFFVRFESGASFDAVMAFAPHMMFWVMAFQDILRLNNELIQDRALRKIAVHHRREDAGHDAWFLDDLRALGAHDRDVSLLFGPEHAATRAAAYGLVSEVYRATDDRVRLALVLTIESAGHAFFERVAPYVEQEGHAQRLRYFAPSHLAVELAHSVFSDEATRLIDELVLPENVRAESYEMVERVFHAFIAMFDALPDLEQHAAPVARIA
jgi:hypothetical protein